MEEKIVQKTLDKSNLCNKSVDVKEHDKEDKRKQMPKKGGKIRSRSPRVMAQPDRHDPPPPPLPSASTSSSYEGRPSYQYDNISITSSSLVEGPNISIYHEGDDRNECHVDILVITTDQQNPTIDYELPANLNS